MADKPKETHTEHTNTEVAEVQSFSGGEMTSIEPIAEVHHDLHAYAGGEIVEHSSRTISPILWGFWAIVILVIIGVLLGTGAIPWIHIPGVAYPTPAGIEASYRLQYAKEMQAEVPESSRFPVEQTMIVMYNLPRPKGQTLDQAIAAGSDIYQTYCIGCHGPNQDGTGPNSVSLDPKPRNLRNAAFMQSLSYERINQSVHKGVPGTAMPRWESQLSDDQIEDVICYVLSLTAPTDPTSGKFLTESQLEQAMSSNGSNEPEQSGVQSGNIRTLGVNNTAPATVAPPITEAPEGAAAPPQSTSSPTAIGHPFGPSNVPTRAAYPANPKDSRQLIGGQ